MELGFCLVTKLGFFKVLWTVVNQTSQKTHKPTTLSQALFCATQLNYFPYEGDHWAQCVLLCSSSGCWFSRCAPPCTQGFSDSASSPWVSWSWLSVWLWLIVGRKRPPSHGQTLKNPLALACRQQAPKLPVRLPALHRGPGLLHNLGNRGWEGWSGETERRERRPRKKKKGVHFKGYFLSWLPLFSFSPHYQDVWCQTFSSIQLRWEMRYNVQTKKKKNWKWQLIMRGRMPAPPLLRSAFD